ncbi:MAG: DUF3418 domain-containing protein, partial [Fibrobacter sp.]|nr:DUF3418 domain-containing protein [Fibrobacter sp.]
IDPKECARIFFREAVVLMNMARPFAFMEHNDRVIQNLHAQEARERKFGLAPNEEMQVDYLMSVAPDVCSIRTLKTFILEHTDAALRFDPNYFIEQSHRGVEYHDSFQNKIQWPSKNQKQEIPTLTEKGTSIEFFRIAGESVQGELVFNASQNNDGLSLKIPHTLIPSLSPAFLALQLSRWRHWMLEAMIRELPKVNRKSVKNQFEEIDDHFCVKLEQHPNASPFLALYEALAEMKGLDDIHLNLNPEKEHHLRLHLSFFREGYLEEKKVELSPEWGSFRFFKEIRSLISSFGVDVNLGDFRYGYRLHENALMMPEESDFWQQRLRKIEKGACQQSVMLIMNRLAFIENAGLYSNENPLPHKDEVFKTLVTEPFEPDELDRFSHLHFSRSKKVNDFKALQEQTKPEQEIIRLILNRMTFESGLLGKEAFVRCYETLKRFCENTRGNRPVDPVFKKKVLAFPEISSQYNRLKYIEDWLESGNSFSLVEDPMDLIQWKSIRESFRPYFVARYIKEDEQIKMRHLLSALEKEMKSSNDYFEIWLEVQLLLEEFEYFKFKRSILFESDALEVEKSSIVKLKGRFGKL